MKVMEQRVRAIWAVAAVLAAGVTGTALGQAQSRTGAAGTDKAAIEAIVRDYILSHPEIIP